ncbi:MAG: hypothetical protein A2066_00770 [Bacteroidetes bacterium GWB2_41_8]|nr:MAG: hypothetical protein A2066_00770 [Bacteroidetes bacterium GWB2_41_8]
MMSYLTEELMSDIKEEFFEISFDYREIHFGGIIPAFFIYIMDNEILEKKWKAITEFIAVHFQSSLKEEFSLWNIYLFFVLENEVRDDLKYIIENDTFSSRKIIVSPKQDIDLIINDHIKSDDINTQSITDFEEKPFLPNPDIWKILNKISPKKKITEEIRLGLDQIIAKIKTENQ